MLNSEKLRDIVTELRAESGKGIDTEELFEDIDKL
jgi:hypothetical protein